MIELFQAVGIYLLDILLYILNVPKLVIFNLNLKKILIESFNVEFKQFVINQ